MRPLQEPKQKLTEPPKECIEFSNSPVEDVDHAKSFWKSLTLQPPLESRLVSADIRQRLRIAVPPEKAKNTPLKPGTTLEEAKTAVFLHNAHKQDIETEKKKYGQLMVQREAALNLLHKQRLERLQKEMISIPFRPTIKNFVKDVKDDYILDEI